MSEKRARPEVRQLKQRLITERAFVLDCCRVVQGARTTNQELLDAYLDYCRERYVEPVHRRTFAMLVREEMPTLPGVIHPRGSNVWLNLKIDSET